MNWYLIAAVLLALWNLTAFVTVVRDKRIARRNGVLPPEQRRRRTPEKRFLFYAAALGGPGVLLGFYTVRHKTKHYGLLAGTWVLTLLSWGGAFCLWYFVLR